MRLVSDVPHSNNTAERVLSLDETSPYGVSWKLPPVSEGGTGRNIGEIVIWVSPQIPPGFFELNGSPVPEGTPLGQFLLSNGQVSNGDGTVNLYDWRGRFPFHRTDSRPLMDMGGAEQVTITTDTMPSHSHSVSTSIYTGGSRGYYGGNPAGYSFSSGAVGGGLPHQNMPPYISIIFIIYGGAS